MSEPARPHRAPRRPAAVAVRPRRHRGRPPGAAGRRRLVRSFAIVGYPREVGHGWLEPLTAHPGRLDVAVHVEPVPANIAADRLRRQLARLESGRRADAAKGRLGRPRRRGRRRRRPRAGRRAGPRASRSCSGSASTSPSTPAASRRSTPSAPGSGRVCSSMLLDAQPATWRTLQGWTVDPAGRRRRPRPAALASTPTPSPPSFPFASAELSATTRRPLRHRHQRLGAGAVGPLRPGQPQLGHPRPLAARASPTWPSSKRCASLYAGIEIAVVDPEDEYRRLAETVGGAYVHLGAPGVRVNPFDLAPGPDALTRRALFVHTLDRRAARRQSPTRPSTAALDRGIVAAYESVGITADPRSHARPAPLLARPRRCPRRRRRSRRPDAGRPARAVRHRHPPGAVRRADHHPPRRPPRRLLPPRPARRAEGGRDAAHPRRHLAAGVRPRRTASAGW